MTVAGDASRVRPEAHLLNPHAPAARKERRALRPARAALEASGSTVVVLLDATHGS